MQVGISLLSVCWRRFTSSASACRSEFCRQLYLPFAGVTGNPWQLPRRLGDVHAANSASDDDGDDDDDAIVTLVSAHRMGLTGCQLIEL